jgi:hypothetical protein
MLHARLDLSRRKLDVCLLSDEGDRPFFIETISGTPARPAEREGLSRQPSRRPRQREPGTLRR